MPEDFGETYHKGIMDRYRVYSTLNSPENVNKNFVQRILKPHSYEWLDLGEGEKGTHMMSYKTGEKGAFVYPEIIQGADGKLIRLGRDEAWAYALKTGEYIRFDSAEEADWFGKNYKLAWE